MKRNLIIILGIFLMLSSFSPAHAADEVINTGDAINVITIERAKTLVYNNSRDLRKYEIRTNKAKYELSQAEHQRDDDFDRYNSLSLRYDSLLQEYADLQAEDGDEESIKEIKNELNSIEREMDSLYQKISSDDSIDAFKNKYDDAVRDEENYKKQLDYIVEDLYIKIIAQEKALMTLQKEYDLKNFLYEIEKAKIFLGSTNQAKLDETAADVKELNQKIINQTNIVKTLKGRLNDMMGLEYDDELKLSPFEVPENTKVPEYDQLIPDVLSSYDVIYEIKRDINERKDDLEYQYNYYQYKILDYEIQEKELQLEDEKYNLLETINNLTAEEKQKKEDYQLAFINFKQAKKQYQWDAKRFQLGQISKLQLLESELNCINMENKKLFAQYDLYLAQRVLQLVQEGIIIN